MFVGGALSAGLGAKLVNAKAPPLPLFNAARCVTARLPAADCAACVAACPAGALSLAGASLALAASRCTGCGHCAAVCPEAALALPDAAPVVLWRHEASACLACRHAAEAPPGRALCAQALGLEELAALWLSGLRVLLFASGDCTRCPEAPPAGLGLASRLSRLNALLASRGLAPLRTRPAPAGATARHTPSGAAARHAPSGVAARHASEGAQNPARRAFFAPFAAPLAAAAETVTAPLTEGGPKTALARLQALPAAPGAAALFAHAPRIAAPLCTGCDACVKLCPQAALILVKDEMSHPCYRVDPAACTGCGLCTDICDTGAMALDEPGEASPEVRLYEYDCRSCRAHLHHPDPGLAARGLCPACARPGWGRAPVLVLP